jgi:hypothetical protein
MWKRVKLTSSASVPHEDECSGRENVRIVSAHVKRKGCTQDTREWHYVGTKAELTADLDQSRCSNEVFFHPRRFERLLFGSEI